MRALVGPQYIARVTITMQAYSSDVAGVAMAEGAAAQDDELDAMIDDASDVDFV